VSLVVVLRTARAFPALASALEPSSQNVWTGG